MNFKMIAMTKYYIFSFMILLLGLSNTFAANDHDHSRIMKMQSQQIMSLKSRLENLENTVYELEQEIKAIKHSTTNDNNSGSSLMPEHVSEPVVSKINQERRDYDLALANLKESKFAEAEKLFKTFLKKYPDSKLQSNAMFWYAETFFRRSIFNKAAIHYLKCYKEFPKGVKASDALLKLSLALANLNKYQEACNMLKKLDKEFPQRSINSINRARDAKNKFGCN